MSDRDSAPWWDALARHELVQQRCAACGAWRWPPRAICGRCASLEWAWHPITGTGTVVSHVRTHHAFLPEMPPPYSTVLVALAEQDDVVLVGSWEADGEPAIGMAVEACIRDGRHGALLGWRPA